jgi:hypothetical protein
MNSIDSTEIPPLGMDLHKKKKSIAIIWSLLIFMTSIMVEILYFSLRYGAKSSTDTALTIPTAILLGFSILTIGFRTFQLIRKGSTRRPVGGKWWAVRWISSSQLERR